MGSYHGTRKATWRERYAGQPEASHHRDYRGHEVRYHVDAHGVRWFVLADIFRAIGRHKTSLMRKRLGDSKDLMLVLAWVPNAANPVGGGGAMLQAANLAGLKQMLGWRDLNASALYTWLA